MKPNQTRCPPHLFGKLHESPLPEGFPPLPDGYAHVMGPFADNSGLINMNIMSLLDKDEWDKTGWIGCDRKSYAVPRHWIASEMPRHAIHVEVRLPDVQPIWDEVETFLVEKYGCWIAGIDYMEWFSRSGCENYFDIQEGRFAVGRTKEEAIANYLKRKAGK